MLLGSVSLQAKYAGYLPHKGPYTLILEAAPVKVDRGKLIEAVPRYYGYKSMGEPDEDFGDEVLAQDSNTHLHCKHEWPLSEDFQTALEEDAPDVSHLMESQQWISESPVRVITAEPTGSKAPYVNTSKVTLEQALIYFEKEIGKQDENASEEQDSGKRFILPYNAQSGVNHPIIPSKATYRQVSKH